MLKRLLLALAVATLCVAAQAQTASQVPAAKSCFTGSVGLTGMVNTLGSITGGAGGMAGTYPAALLGGTGAGASATFIVSGGAVTSVTVTSPGAGYTAGDTLTASSSAIGGVTGFSVPVATTAISGALAAGSATFYVPGTTTPKSTWQDAGQTILNTNPVALDGNGCALIYGTGSYRQIIKDSLGNVVWDQTVTTAQPSTALGTGVATALANAVNTPGGVLTMVAGGPPVTVANNAGLNALSTASIISGASIFRQGYASAGDGGAAWYNASNSACSLNSGAGDGGSQVPSANSKCWIIDVDASGGLWPKMFGAVGDDVHDDTTAFNNLTAAAIRLTLNLNWGKPSVAWRITSTYHVDYVTLGQRMWEIHADGAWFHADFSSAGGSTQTPAFLLTCGGTPGVRDSAQCLGLHMRGNVRFQGILANDFLCVLGYPDGREVQQGMIIDYLFCANSSTDAKAGGILTTFATTDHLYMFGDTNIGGGAGVANAEGYSGGRTWTGLSMTTISGGATAVFGDLIADSIFSGTPFNNTGNDWLGDNDWESGTFCFVVRATYFTNDRIKGLLNCPRAFDIPALSTHSNNTIETPEFNGNPYQPGIAFGVNMIGGSANRLAYQRPYGTSYSINGMDDGGIISTACASSGGPIVNLLPTATTPPGGTTMQFSDSTAANIQVGYVVTALGFPAGTTVLSVTGTGPYTVTVNNGATSGGNLFYTPVDFRPASCGAGGSTLVVSLPSCGGASAVDLGARWSTSFLTENSNGATINTAGGELIFSNPGTATSLSLSGGATNVAKLTCYGSGIWFKSIP